MRRPCSHPAKCDNRPSVRRAAFQVSIAGSLFLSGCLGSNYRVDQGELQRLASLAPSERGVVRAVQELSFAQHSVGEDVEFYVAPSVAAVELADSVGRPVVRTGVTGNVVRAGGAVRVADGGGRVRTGGPVQVGDGGSRPSVQVSADSSGSTGNTGGSSGSGSGGEGLAVIAVAVAAVATAGILVAAASEGSRFDGWLTVEPQNLLHLYRQEVDGEYWLAVPVNALHPELALWADGAVVQPAPGITEYGRAPLDRQGFVLTANALLSSAYSPIEVRRMVGGSRMGFGYFPHQNFGLLTTLDVQGASGVLSVRFGGELQAFFPSAGLFSFGLYGEGGGVRTRAENGGLSVGETHGYFGGGGILQVEISTRLAFEIRGGVWSSQRQVFPTFGVGLSVY